MAGCWRFSQGSGRLKRSKPTFPSLILDSRQWSSRRRSRRRCFAPQVQTHIKASRCSSQRRRSIVASKTANTNTRGELDGMTWSAFQPQSTFLITHPILLLQGHHELEVRARRVDDYRTLDPTPAIHEFSIDTEPPMLELTRSDGRVRVEVSDFVSARDELRVEYQAHERIWVGVDGDEFTFDPQASVTVRATDQAGLTSTVTIEARRSALIGRPAPGERNPGGGCECNQNPQNSNSALLMFLCLLMIRPRRSKEWLISVLFLCVGIVFVGCDDHPERWLRS